MLSENYGPRDSLKRKTSTFGLVFLSTASIRPFFTREIVDRSRHKRKRVEASLYIFFTNRTDKDLLKEIWDQLRRNTVVLEGMRLQIRPKKHNPEISHK